MGVTTAISLVFLLAMTFTVSCTDAKLPGFKVRITKPGIDYGNKMAHAAMAKALRTLKIPDQEGKDGHITYTLTGIQNRGSTVPATSMALMPAVKGLSWSMSNLGLSLHADWRVKYKKGWVKISTSGSVDADIRGVSLQVNITLGVDSKGKPTVSPAGCAADVSSVKLDFHGGTAFIINLFKGTLGRRVRDLLKDQMCQLVKKEVSGDGAKALSKLKLSVELLKRFLLDYSLTQAPNVQSVNIETDHKGEVFWIGDKKEAPYNPKPFPPLADNSKMVYLWLSEYIANSMAYVAQEHNFLQYNLTKDNIPPGNQSLLNTTCRTVCIGKLIPQIGQKYPNSIVKAEIKSASVPVATFSKTSMTLDTHAIVSLFADTPSNKTVFLITLQVNMSLSLKADIIDEKVTGQITGNTFKLSVTKSAVGTVSAPLLNLVLGGALKLFIIPKLNALAEKGVDLPVTGGLQFINTSITQLDGSFVIATDLKALKPPVLKFQTEKRCPKKKQ